MRKRHQTGGIKKQRGRWIGMWWVDSGRKSRVLGLVKEMSKSEARKAVNRIVAEENTKRQAGRSWRFGEFVNEIYVPYYTRKWKKSTRENNVNRTSIHLVASSGIVSCRAFAATSFRTSCTREQSAASPSPSSIT